MKWYLIAGATVLSFVGVFIYNGFDNTEIDKQNRLKKKYSSNQAIEFSSQRKKTATIEQKTVSKKTTKKSEAKKTQSENSLTMPTDNIELTDAQKSKYEIIVKNYAELRKNLLLQRKTIAPETYRQYLISMKEKHNDNLVVLMSEKQYSQYTANIESAKKYRQQHNKSHIKHLSQRRPPRKSDIKKKGVL